MDDKSPTGREMTFADFLSGHTDVSYLVNPHANSMGSNLLTKKDMENTCSKDHGFGSANLDVLE